MDKTKKENAAPDDWDSLPLDPAADDWDEPSPPAAGVSAPQGDEKEDDFDSPSPPEAEGSAPQGDEDDFDEPSTSPAAPPPAPPEAEGSAPQEDEDDFDEPSPPAAGGAPQADEKAAGSPPGPFDAFLGENAGEGEGFTAPSAQPFAPARKPAGSRAPAPEEGHEEDHPGDVNADIDKAFGNLEQKPAQPVIQKVELDIEGIAFDEMAPPAPPPPEAPEPAEAPPAELPPAAEAPPAESPAPPEENIGRRKIPIIKLLILILPALVVLGGGSYGFWRLFIYSPPAPPVLVIDPAAPHRDPAPGEMSLKPFYINFAGEPETIVEMSVVLYYNDSPYRELIEANLPAVREVIFRLTRDKGGQAVTSGEIQRDLRRELALAANAVLGAEAISYVQLTQFRILH